MLANGEALEADLSQHPRRYEYICDLLRAFFLEWHKVRVSRVFPVCFPCVSRVLPRLPSFAAAYYLL